MAEGTNYECPHPFSGGMGNAYAVCGDSMCHWDMGGGGLSPLGSSRPLFNDF